MVAKTNPSPSSPIVIAHNKLMAIHTMPGAGDVFCRQIASHRVVYITIVRSSTPKIIFMRPNVDGYDVNAPLARTDKPNREKRELHFISHILRSSPPNGEVDGTFFQIHINNARCARSARRTWRPHSNKANTKIGKKKVPPKDPCLVAADRRIA